MKRSGIICVSLLLGSCHSAKPDANAPSYPLEAKLFHDSTPIAERGGQTFPSPLVKGTVGSVSTIIVVDTGAQAPAIDAALAAQAGLATVDDPTPATDPAGQPVTIKRVDHPRLAVEGLGSLPDAPALVIDLPPVFKQLGIGALLPPQALTGPGHVVVVDLPRGVLSLMKPLQSWERYGSFGRIAIPETTPVCKSGSQSLPTRILLTPAFVMNEHVVLEVDLGASGNSLLAVAPAGAALAATGKGTEQSAATAAGTFTLQKFSNVPLRVGSLDLVTDVAVTPGNLGEPCGWHGRLGMSVLRQCVLFLTPESHGMRCVEPPPAP